MSTVNLQDTATLARLDAVVSQLANDDVEARFNNLKKVSQKDAYSLAADLDAGSLRIDEFGIKIVERLAYYSKITARNDGSAVQRRATAIAGVRPALYTDGPSARTFFGEIQRKDPRVLSAEYASGEGDHVARMRVAAGTCYELIERYNRSGGRLS